MLERGAAAAWVALLVADLAVAAYGVMAAALPDQVLAPSYESFTGSAWSTLRSADPHAAAYITLSGRVIGGLNVAFGLAGAAIAAFGLRRHARWAWLALAGGNAFGYGTPIAFDLTTGRIALFEYLEFALAAVAVAGLLLVAPSVFGRPEPASGAASRARRGGPSSARC